MDQWGGYGHQRYRKFNFLDFTRFIAYFTETNFFFLSGKLFYYICWFELKDYSDGIV
jgi:hypothetical protein